MDDLTFDLLGKIKQACDLLDEVEDYVKDLDDRHSNCDMKLSDMYHLIETSDVDNWSKSELRNVTREIKSICEVRRKVKINIALRRVYQDNVGKLNNSANRAMLLEKLYKSDKQYNSDYVYRVYKEDEISKLVVTKPVPEHEEKTDDFQEEIIDDLE